MIDFDVMKEIGDRLKEVDTRTDVVTISKEDYDNYLMLRDRVSILRQLAEAKGYIDDELVRTLFCIEKPENKNKKNENPD